MSNFLPQPGHNDWVLTEYEFWHFCTQTLNTMGLIGTKHFDSRFLHSQKTQIFWSRRTQFSRVIQEYNRIHCHLRYVLIDKMLWVKKYSKSHCILSLNFCFIILVWGPLVIQLKYCPVLPSLNKVDYYYYYRVIHYRQQLPNPPSCI